MSNRPKLGRIDIKILAELQRNGNITNANLAAAVGLSASPCLQRVKRLESAGVISGYGAHVNVAKVTSIVSVFTEIMLHDHRREDFVRFEANVRDFDEITECHLVSGGYDYPLKFLVKGIRHHPQLIQRLLHRHLRLAKHLIFI